MDLTALQGLAAEVADLPPYLHSLNLMFCPSQPSERYTGSIDLHRWLLDLASLQV